MRLLKAVCAQRHNSMEQLATLSANVTHCFKQSTKEALKARSLYSTLKSYKNLNRETRASYSAPYWPSNR